MRQPSEARRLVATLLCWSLLLPFAPGSSLAAGEAAPPPECPAKTDLEKAKQEPPAAAQGKDEGKGPRNQGKNAARKRRGWVTVTPGQPSVWSLGQAHYLIANLHERDRDLSTKMPTTDDLDPNRINSARLEVLRTLLQGEVQFDQPLGVKNAAEQQRFSGALTRQQQAQDALPDRRADLAEVDRELGVLGEELAVLKEQDRQSTEARAATKPPTAPSPADNERKLRIVVLTARVDEKTAEKTRLQSEITSLETTAGAAVTAPDVKGPELTAGRASLPSSPAFDEFLKKAINSFNQPTLAASTALDNFVGMQYEIVAKQLTLLRDEAGPDERVIFLELPTSIYTVDGWADDYIAQVEWTVEKYYDREPSRCEVRRTLCDFLPTELDEILTEKKDNGKDKRWTSTEQEGTRRHLEAFLDRTEVSPYVLTECLGYPDPSPEARSGEIKDEMQYPVTLDMIKAMAADSKDNSAVDPDSGDSAGRFKVRALDIIPRQSALNVNEQHATVKNTGLLGILKLISGFGAKLDFQRQREVYDQYLQQEVFASGSGKGTNTFGWTFGPLPGSRRLAPGLRTTYAVLAVPRSTLALELKARSRVFRRYDRPKDRPGDAPDLHLLVSVPGPKTEAFVIERANYTPVLKGGRTTVVMKGSFLSPQLGVIVNGVPLKRVISIARTGSREDSPASPGSGVQGEFEITNTRQVVLSFSMGSDFVGTPLVTLVTPEKSVTLNYTSMIVNNRYRQPISLQAASSFEPMFIDGFSLTHEVERFDEKKFKEPVDGKSQEVKYVVARLRGKGLRHDVDVFVNEKELAKFPIRFPSHEQIKAFTEKKADCKDLEDELKTCIARYGTVAKCGEPQARLASCQDLVRQVQDHFKKNHSFAVQESTGTSILFLHDPGDDWAVSYRQRTRQGFEEDSFKKSFAVDDVTAEVRHYRRGTARRPAEAFLTVTGNAAPLDRIELIEPPPYPGSRCNFQDGNVSGKKRPAKCTIAWDGGKERDFITVKVSFANPAPDSKDKDNPKPGADPQPAQDPPGAKSPEEPKKTPDPIFLDIDLPVQTVVATVVNPATGNASGPAGQPAYVIIRGEKLGDVKAVFFGDLAGTDLTAGPAGLTVKVPKLDGVPKGQAVAVPVLFQTRADGETKVPSGAFYTYLGEPLPEQVVVWPYPPGPYPAAVPEPRKP